MILEHLTDSNYIEKVLAKNKGKFLLLDRDGVINVDYGYVGSKDRLDIYSGIFSLCKCYSTVVFIVTNQSGIGRKYYTDDEFRSLQDHIFKIFNAKGIEIIATAYCPHLPSDECGCRKPQPGLINELNKRYSIDLSKGFLIGDKETDMLLARQFNMKKFQINWEIGKIPFGLE
ncbi:HAD-IIIA family hydrolase [Planktomarina temperata]|nr:HAD-IIIA family hydrolase [Planktomarina temperata]